MAVTQLQTGTTIEGEPDNYTLYQRTGSDKQIFLVCGDNITLRYLTLDFNMDTWVEFSRLIQFGSLCSSDTKSNILIEHCDFINSGSAVHDGSGDCWGITIDGAGAIDGVTVRNCRMLFPDAQLTAGTLLSNAVCQNITIENNYVNTGRSNAIAISSNNDNVTISNVTIRGNAIYNVTGVGIFVGNDASEGTMEISDVLIEGNHIVYAAEPRTNFPSAMLLKGDDTTPFTGITYRGNFIDTSAITSESVIPRFVNYQEGVVSGDSSVQVTLSRNVKRGDGIIPSSAAIEETDGFLAVP